MKKKLLTSVRSTEKVVVAGLLGSAFCLLYPAGIHATLSSALPDISLLSGYTEFGNLLTESLVTVNGNVGVSGGGTLQLNAPSTINGNVYVDSTATFNNAGTVTGTIFKNQNLSAQQAQVFTASSALAGLSADYTALGSGNFSAAAGNVTVVKLSSLNLNNQNINFTGDGYLVLDISGTFSLGGTASILAADPTHVFVNYTGTGTINTHVGDVVDGYIFDPYGTGNLDGTWFGGLYGGDGKITLLSGAKFTAPQSTPVPEPSTMIAGALLLVPLSFSVFRILRKKQNATV